MDLQWQYDDTIAEVDTMNNISKVALLKLIRDNQPISLQAIYEMLQERPELHSQYAYRHLLDNLRSYSRHAVEDLLALNLVELERGEPFSPDARLSLTQTVPRLQELFRFSLTCLIESGENPIQISPQFGTPQPQKTGASVFVAMPFKEDMKAVFSDHIQKVTKALNLTCKRADDLFTANAIVQDVWSAIYHAELLIVDCTGRNPNVFYELGIAHTLGRKTILIAQSIDDIPTDIRHLRVIIYQYTPPGMSQFENELTETIKTELNLNA